MVDLGYLTPGLEAMTIKKLSGYLEVTSGYATSADLVGDVLSILALVLAH